MRDNIKYKVLFGETNCFLRIWRVGNKTLKTNFFKCYKTLIKYGQNDKKLL
jgi:hypothetical protein